MERSTYLKLRNRLLTPLTWLVCLKAAAVLTGLEYTWRLVLFSVLMALVSDMIDFIVEKRPLIGPKRWE